MRWRAKWSHVTIGLALIAALAIAAPAIGGPSLKALVKKEVAKQIRKATGPAGANGTNGANGADGTARAYAVVNHACAGGPPEVCGFDHSKGVSGVTRPFTGDYCVNAPGIRADSVPAAVTVEWSGTTNPEGNASAMTDANDLEECPAGQFEVITERHSDTAGSDAVAANDIGFTIVIP